MRFIVNLAIFLFCFYSSNVESANILALLGMPSPSHHIWNSALTHALAEKGHNLTILSADIPKSTDKVPKNAHYLHLEKLYETIYAPQETTGEAANLNDFIGKNILLQITDFYEFGDDIMRGIVNSNGFKTLLNYPDTFKFDLVILDYTMGPMLLGFMHKFKYPPLVGVTAFLNPPLTRDLIGGHYYPSYIPFHSAHFNENMNFFERFYNTLVYTVDTLYRRYIFTPSLDKVMQTFFGNTIPPLRKIEQKTVLALVNTHSSINIPEPLPPNVIEVGGLQIKEPKPLPKDIEDFIQSSKKGAIFFSLGTNMKSEFVGPVNTKIIIDAMAECSDYHFLWKFDQVPKEFKIPKNVQVKSFYPQNDILGHPKTKVFVTHAGGLSILEASWHGVPLVGIPLFVDQHMNMKKSLDAGAGVFVDYLKLNVPDLRNAILEVAENRTYHENMKRRSTLSKDRPMKPLDTAIWWIEYVLRNPNPEHMQSPARKLGFIKANCLDILFTSLAVIVLLIYVLLWSCCKICKLFKKSKPSEKKKKA